MKIVFFTGAGVSRESGLLTFRDCGDGLWNNYRIEDVCTAQAWRTNRAAVLDFYNMRRKEVLQAAPNAAHEGIAALERDAATGSGEPVEVVVVTQNIDDLHERAGSRHVLHIHGELLKSRSEADQAGRPRLFDCRGDLAIGDMSAVDGRQLRPHVVFFGENLYDFETAWEATSRADILIVVGTSLQVFPAADIAFHTRAEHIWVVDPTAPDDAIVETLERGGRHVHAVVEPASLGVPIAIESALASR